jgi:hypothetical protein
MIVCIAEDRPSFEVPVKLLLLSLARHCGDLRVNLVYPNASASFVAWIARLPHVDLDVAGIEGAQGWNVKAQALLALLEAGHDDVVWIDSDVIVTGDFRPDLKSLDQRTVMATEEALWGYHSDAEAWRARCWGMSVGRVLPFTINTAVLRVTQCHIPLLLEWRRLLESKTYRSAQRLDPDQRPQHMFGDQDVLTALMTSREFSDVDVKFFRRGPDIIQYFGLSGYTCAERLRHLVRGPPKFVHSQVFKPWVKFRAPRSIENLRDLADTLYLDLSPYTLAARRYLRELAEPCPWMRPQSRAAAMLRAMGLWYAPLVGLPMAALADIVRTANLGMLKRFYFKRTSLRESAVEGGVGGASG